MPKRWLIAPTEPEAAGALARELDLPVPIAQTLLNRGYRDAGAARRFLQPQLRQLVDPFTLPDMASAVERIRAALANHERIVIYGDYDVDGVTSSVLLTRVLRALGGEVLNFLPHRLDEGYGLSGDGIERCLREHRPQLLIAVDCGTSSVREIEALREQGVETIVLDHHEPPAEVPECVALVNPKIVGRVPSRGDGPHAASGDAAYNTPFCSVGVAFKLAHALLKTNRDWKIDLREHLDLVAIGTVADVVPLTGENRILVKTGLERVASTKKVGLRALMEVAGVGDNVSPHHIGFRLGPRLNAAGRLADAMAALELLLTEDAGRAAELAKLLNDHNTERQRIEERIVAQALEEAKTFSSDRILVLANDTWHVGVIGIVASRVMQEFYRPVIVIGAEGKGSCRSINGFNIVGALTVCATLLERFGGHEMAAGLTVKMQNVAALRRALNEHAGGVLSEETLTPMIRVDAVVGLGELDAEFFEALEKCEPCGAGNPTPVFAVRNVMVRGKPRTLKGGHLKFFVTDGETTVDAIWFGGGDVALPSGGMDVAFTAEMDDYRGEPTVQLRVKDVRPARQIVHTMVDR